MEEKNLEFLNTRTIEQFKDDHKVSKIEVKRNEETGKLFFTFGAETGAVSSKGIPKNPMISLVQGNPTDRNPDGKFYLLHEEGTGGAPTIATF